MVKEKMNESFSWKGYSVKVWALKNKESLKLIMSGTFGLLTATVTSLDPKWSIPLGVLVTTVSKIAVDALDYWQSE